jgi:lipopolysaccharide biosynthesis glycosyltransferase
MRQFCRQLAVVVAGLSRVAAGTPHLVFVLHDGYSEDLQRRIAKGAGEEIELRWLDARSADLDSANLPGHLPPSTLYRLRLEELLPTEVDRAIYLDAHVAIRD